MDVKESYRVLELEIGASRDVVEAAYCRLLERWHPDRAAAGGPEAVREAQRMVQAINDAYQTLTKIAPAAPDPSSSRPTGDAPTAAAKPPTKPMLRPLPAGQSTVGRLPPPPPPPPPATWAARPAPAVGAFPPPPAASPAAPSPTKSRSPSPAAKVSPAPAAPKSSVEAAPAAAAPSGKAATWYEKFFPVGSPQRRFAPVIPVVALVVVVLVGKFAFPSAGGQPAQAATTPTPAADPKMIGDLVVKSNVANTTVEATRIPAAGEAEPAAITGTDGGAAEQTLTGLRTGKYAVTARAGGWPEIRQEVNVEAGRTTEVAVNFKSGSLRLDSDPAGATVRLGASVLGVTPLVVAQLPPGACQLTLKYQSWPVATFKTTITEGAEATGTVRLPHGKLTVETTPPGVTVLLGEFAVGQTPLTLERVPAGPKKVTLRAKDFPALEVAVNVEDRGDVKIHPALGSAFPVLDPAALLRTIWIPDDEDRIAPPNEGVTGSFQSKNGIVKNLNRKRLFETWLRKRYGYSAIVKAYDRTSGQVEFAEQQSELAKFRVLAQLSPEARNDPALAAQLTKGATFALYGRLTAVEEPRWPSKVITFELSLAEPLR